MVTVPNERVTDCPALPRGWKRKEMLRKSGLASAKVEVCYISPTNRVFTSKSQLQRFLGDQFDLSDFDFQSGRRLGPGSQPSHHHQQHRSHAAGGSATSVHHHNHPPLSTGPTIHPTTAAMVRAKVTGGRLPMPGANFSLVLPPAPNANQTPKTTSQHSLLTANQTAQPQKSAAAGNLAPAAAPAPNRNDLQCPVRQTASIFKQPVTLVHTTSRETKPTPQNNELHKIHGGKIEKPKQVFWAKRLQGLRAIIAGSSVDLDEVDEELSALPQPARILPIGPNVDADVAEASLAASLRNAAAGQRISGQTEAKKLLDANPGVYVNCEQPLVQAVVVTEQDVSSQEQRVFDARKRLEEALKHFGP